MDLKIDWLICEGRTISYYYDSALNSMTEHCLISNNAF